MAIYARFGTRVELTAARFIPIWIEHRPGETKWHYAEPKRTKRTGEVKQMPLPFVTAIEADTKRPICDGKWLDLNTFRADDGIKELMFKLLDLDPVGVAKAEQWNKADAPEASELFEPINEKMVA